MSVETVARRYASALADIVMKSGEKDVVKSELKTWEEMLNSNRDLNNAFYNPAITQDSKEKVLEKLLARSNPSKTTANFLRILLKNKRLTEINAINEKFDLVLAERSGVISASVTSSRELSDGEKNDLKANLAKLTGGKEIKIDYKIDENIIGGAITRVGSTVYDGSVKTQLEILKNQMIKS
jgi:F-type H+-transporting ATPase subunit delta